MDSIPAQDIIEHIINAIIGIKKDRPLLIAFDGVDTSGKTTFADAVGAKLGQKSPFKPVRIGIDKFHNPKAVRLVKGALSPEGFFHDSFNYEKIYQNVLLPVKRNAGFVIPGMYEYKSDKEINPEKVRIDSSTVILFDGIFLNRDELYKVWDLSIFLEVTFETVIERALQRDLGLFGSREIVLERYQKRYIPGERIYLQTCRPTERADIVIDNNDYLNPKLLKSWKVT